LTIKITGARNAKGQVGVAFFQEAKGSPRTPLTRSVGKMSTSTPSR
jgi:uncharacterized protein (DUF2141 family)